MLLTPSQTKESLLRKLRGVNQVPDLPIVLEPLLTYLQQPVDSMQVAEVVRLISRDKALTAQCLHLANSPLFGRWQPVDTVHGAVVALGLRRMREIATSCCLLNLTPRASKLDPVVFWEHALGCALVSRHLARAVGFADPEKAYLAGLLHDFGILMHLWLAPREFQEAWEKARAAHIPLQDAEEEVLGVGHSETGRMLAERWRFGDPLVAAIGGHHDVAKVTAHRSLVAIVALSDVLCRMGGLNHGYSEERQVDMVEEPAFAVLSEEFPAIHTLDWERLTFELDTFVVEVHQLVNVVSCPK